MRARQMSICNACRYCEGYCAVFPAMELRRTFARRRHGLSGQPLLRLPGLPTTPASTRRRTSSPSTSHRSSPTSAPTRTSTTAWPARAGADARPQRPGCGARRHGCVTVAVLVGLVLLRAHRRGWSRPTSVQVRSTRSSRTLTLVLARRPSRLYGVGRVRPGRHPLLARHARYAGGADQSARVVAGDQRRVRPAVSQRRRLGLLLPGAIAAHRRGASTTSSSSSASG